MMTTMKTAIQMVQTLRKDHQALIFVLIFGILARAISPYYSLYFSAQIINYLTIHQMELAKQMVIYLLVGNFVLGIVKYLCEQAFYMYDDTIDFSYKEKVTEKSFRLGFEGYEKREILEKLEQMEKNKFMYQSLPSQQLKLIYWLGMWILSSLFALGYIGTLIYKIHAQVSFFSYLLLAFIFSIFLYLLFQLNKKSESILNKGMTETLNANVYGNYFLTSFLDIKFAKDFRLFSMASILLDYMEKINQKFNTIHKKYSYYKGKFYGLNALLFELFSGVIFFFVCFQYMNQSIELGDILLYTGAISQFTHCIINISEINRNLKLGKVNLDLYHDFINSNDMDYDGTLPIEKRDDGAYHFEFKNVSFKYPDTEQMILKNINMDFTIGDSYAIVGKNGAGKSTLIKLLCRLYEPTEGTILLNGIDIRKYNYQEYTDIFSVVFQDFKIYALNLDENIACSSQVDENRVAECMKQVGIYEHFIKHPDGLKQLLYKDTGDGVNVSGGEAQKIAIARALYKDAPFVILDEPTSALDPISEAEIYENFNQLIQNKTSIYISHRMSSCQFCKHIIVLDQGEIAERGTHQELLENNGLYASLWQAQAKYYRS